MASKLRPRLLTAVFTGSAASLASAHPGHGAPPSHLHGELIFVGLFVGVLALGLVLRVIDRRHRRVGAARFRP